jgi:hypothetical protein
MFKLLYHYYLIKKSGLFDQKYYLLNNPDVLQADIDPLWHFVRFGIKEERNPSKYYETRSFLTEFQQQNGYKCAPPFPFQKKKPENNLYLEAHNTNRYRKINPELIIRNFNPLQQDYIDHSNSHERLRKCIEHVSGKPKIFCIGLNKTGTTSMAKALTDLGFIVGDQHLAELLLDDWSVRNFKSLYNYCLTAQAFQDIPFSLPYSFQALDGFFPGSKFILTVRDNSEQWYNSLITFQSKFFGKGNVPTTTDFKNANYGYPGFKYNIFKWVYNTPEEDPYNKEIMIQQYEFYNFLVQDYFKRRPNDLLVVNLSDPGSYQKFCEFLEKPYPGGKFPHENKTNNLKTIE